MRTLLLTEEPWKKDFSFCTCHAENGHKGAPLNPIPSTILYYILKKTWPDYAMQTNAGLNVLKCIFPTRNQTEKKKQ